MSAAERVWATMWTFVHDRHDARAAVTAELGLSFFRVKVLRRVAREPSTLRDLVARLGSDPPYVSVVVDDLVERGLVERSSDPADRRRKIVTVTPEGAAVAARADRILATPPPALAAMPEEDLATLEALLTRLM